MKTVGKRKASRGGLKEAESFLKLVVKLVEGNESIPKGLYKFKTHEEAHEWSKRIQLGKNK